MRLTDIGRQLSMPKSSTFGLLSTLSGRGYVALRGDGYVISERYPKGDWISGEYGSMRRAAQPVMGRLASETGESCFLAIPVHDWDVEFIEKAVSDHPLRYDISLPTVRPAHSTSVGLVLLADQPKDALVRYLASERIKKVTEKTVTDPGLLLETIELVRLAGFAMSADNSALGASGVAAPIRGPSGATIGALCVIAPTPRFDAARDSITQRVRAAAAQISAQLSPENSSSAGGASTTKRHDRWTI